MNEIVQSNTFHQWLSGLKDHLACMGIYARLDRVRFGSFGDMAPIGEGLSELRIHFGPGYRIYFIQRGKKGGSVVRWR